uniref:Olfactory receptor n=1 Tax=Loxodonta africana TaxID=9785 RepID=G3UKA4_LOXAF
KGVTEFILVGITQDPKRQKMVFIIFLIVYTRAAVGNLLIIVTIKFSQNLGSPMYFFLFYLSIAHTCFSTSIPSRLIVGAFSAKKVISYNKCMMEVFTLHLFDYMEIFVLILMAVDRYVAICKPLHYSTIMRQQVCIILIILAIGSFIHSVIRIVLILKLPFCGPLIDHYCCDLQPLLNLACMNTYVISLLLVSNTGPLLEQFLDSHDLIFCYLALAEKPEGKKTALSTCTSHIIVLILFFGLCKFIYIPPPTTFHMDKTVASPFLNPLIYTLRNAGLKIAMRNLWS